MKNQLSFELENLSSGRKTDASLEKHLSSKKEKKPKQNNKEKQLINEMLSTQKKEHRVNIKSLFLDKLVQKVLFLERTLKKFDPTKQTSKKEQLFDNRIHKLLSTREASDLLGVSENALRILVYRKKVKAYKLGSRLKFRHSDLVNCLQQKEV